MSTAFVATNTTLSKGKTETCAVICRESNLDTYRLESCCSDDLDPDERATTASQPSEDSQLMPITKGPLKHKWNFLPCILLLCFFAAAAYYFYVRIEGMPLRLTRMLYLFALPYLLCSWQAEPLSVYNKICSRTAG